MMTISIIPFEMPHYPAARALWECTEGMGLSGADEPEPIAVFLARNPGLSFVALSGDQLVGTILCGHDGRRGWIHHLLVADGHRKQGLGKALVDHGLSALRQAGIQKCHLMAFRDNVEGARFWKRIGAEERVTLTQFSLPT